MLETNDISCIIQAIFDKLYFAVDGFVEYYIETMITGDEKCQKN